MRALVNGLLVVFAVTLVTSAVPEPAEAQRGSGRPGIERCSRCKSCKKCTRGKWGGKSCSYLSGCCEEEDGNCNPVQTMNTAPSDLRLIDDVLTVRLAGNVFGTWACEDGSLAFAYVVNGQELPEPLSEAELERFETLTFQKYLLNRRKAEVRGQAS